MIAPDDLLDERWHVVLGSRVRQFRRRCERAGCPFVTDWGILPDVYRAVARHMIDAHDAHRFIADGVA